LDPPERLLTELDFELERLLGVDLLPLDRDFTLDLEPLSLLVSQFRFCG
jgi:hypothetical protein